MFKWKDTARTSKEIKRKYSGNEKVVLSKDALVIIERVLADGLFLVVDINPRKSERRNYKLKTSEIIVEDYSITRDINVQMLLADGWDAQDLLRQNN